MFRRSVFTEFSCLDSGQLKEVVHIGSDRVPDSILDLRQHHGCSKNPAQP